MFLSSAEASQCSLCQGYLSVSPILIVSDNPVCGRCTKFRNMEGVRAHFYEELAKYMYFPCKNDMYGCDVLLPWDTSIAHEESCKFKQVTCPVLTCKELVQNQSLKEHISEMHKDQISKNLEFTIDISGKDFTESHLFSWREQIFIMILNKVSQDYQYNMFSVENNNFTYDLVFPNEIQVIGDIFRKNNEILKYSSEKNTELPLKKMDLSSMSKIVGKDFLRCSIIMHDNEIQYNDHLNQNFLLSLQCAICTSYMKPPIYICKIGHSLCSECNLRLIACPTCRKPLEDGRNYTLEQMSEYVAYPCPKKDLGCEFYGKLTKLPSHEAVCSVGQSNLPCERNNSEKHPKRVLRNGQLTKLLLSEMKSLELDTTYDQELFKITLNYIEKRGLQIKVTKTVKDSDKNYLSHLWFRNGLHYLSIANNLKIAEGFVLSYSQIRPFIYKNKIQFKIFIVKKDKKRNV